MKTQACAQPLCCQAVPILKFRLSYNLCIINISTAMQQRLHNRSYSRIAQENPITHAKSYSYCKNASNSKRLLLMLFLQLFLVEVCAEKCYSTAFYGSSCQICFNDPETILNSCQLNGTMTQNCKQVCCGLKYSGKTVSCDLLSSQSTGYKASTIVIFLFIISPLVFCFFKCIYSCICQSQRSSRPDRLQVGRAALPPVNLDQYNLEQCFPYYIDAEQTCAICLEPACHIMTLCGHPYHSSCLRAWISKRESCPFCITDKFNPVALFCTACNRALKLQGMYAAMGQEGTRQWDSASEAKCACCLQGPAEQIEISISEEEVERHQKKVGTRGAQSAFVVSDTRINVTADRQV